MRHDFFFFSGFGANTILQAVSKTSFKFFLVKAEHSM